MNYKSILKKKYVMGMACVLVSGFLVSCGQQATGDAQDGKGIGVNQTEESKVADTTEATEEDIVYVPLVEDVAPVAEEALPQNSGEYVIVYYPSWAKYDSLQAKDIDAEKITHIHYAFAETTREYVPFANNIDEHRDNLEQLVALREKNPDLKLVLSIGGGGGDKYFSSICITDKNLKTFTEGCMDFLTTYDFDGIDLDWEFPSGPAEMKGFTKMVLCLRNAMNQLEAESGRHYSLSLAGAADSGELSGINYDEVLPYLDYVFIMGYNLYGTWSDKTNFNAPMYAPGEEKYTGYSLYNIVETYINGGVPGNKLVLGLPLYGYVLPVKSTDNNGLYQPFESVSYDTAYESCRNVYANYLGKEGYTEFWDEDTQSPYLFGENTFIGFENEKSITAKASLVGQFQLAGVGFWELSQDTEDFRMLNAAYEAMKNIKNAEVEE